MLYQIIYLAPTNRLMYADKKNIMVGIIFGMEAEYFGGNTRRINYVESKPRNSSLGNIMKGKNTLRDYSEEKSHGMKNAKEYIWKYADR